MMNDLKTIYVDVVFFTDCSSEVGFVKSRKILKHLWLQNTRVGFVCLLFVFFPLWCFLRSTKIHLK